MQEDGQPQVCKKTIKTTEHCPNLVQSLVQLFKKNMCSLETLAQLLVLQMVMVTAYGAQRNISWIENLEQVLNPPWKCHIPKARLVYMSKFYTFMINLYYFNKCKIYNCFVRFRY